MSSGDPHFSRLAPELIQVAGVMDREEARMLVRCGVRYLGFPLRLDVNEEDLAEEEAASIIRTLQPPCHGVLITYLNRAAEILELAAELGVRIVQVHGDVERSELEGISRRDPGLTVIKSLVVGLHGQADLESMVEALSPCVDAYITDTFDPATGAAGATGRTHDWAVSKALVQCSPRPVILAGGLNPENVRRAILEVKPAGVDVHTGVEDETGRKSRRKVETFVREARAGFAALPGSRHTG